MLSSDDNTGNKSQVGLKVWTWICFLDVDIVSF